MLEHLHAGHDVEAAGHLDRQCFRRHLAIVDVGKARLERMQLRDAQRFLGQVDAKHL